ncbi:hypothetical protein ACKVMT_17165 [Halobacteriales archaeon Cl-PHB]
MTAGGLSPQLEAATTRGGGDTTPVVGANLNGRPRRLRGDLGLLETSETTWVRAFVDVREKLRAGHDPADDPDVLALQQVARRQDCSLVLSLKWNFAATWGRMPPTRVPAPGSSRETALFDCARRYLAAVGEPTDVVVLGNEPLWETLDADLRGPDPPVVRFTRRLKDHLVARYDGDPALLVGAFNRLADRGIRQARFPAFFEGLFDLARGDDVAGADLHVHFDRFAAARAMVATARSNLPDGLLTATEFSPVWRYARHVDEPIGRSLPGREFAARYGIAPDTTAVEYLETAKRDPVSREELGAFVEAMPWYNERHVADVYDLFEAYDVSFGGLGFLQGVEMREEDWTTGWTPFHLNFLFQRALLADDTGGHPAYLDDYRERTGGDGGLAGLGPSRDRGTTG